MELVFFIGAGAVAVASGIMVIVQRNAMYSALFLVLNFFCLALLYVALGAYFLAVVQIAVYAGAIMVLMLFVIMLLNVAQPEPSDRRLGLMRPFGIIAALALVIELGVAIGASRAAPATAAGGGAAPAAVAAPAVRAMPTAVPTPAAGPAAGAASLGHTQRLAIELFTRFLLPFEITSILLLAAILGAAVLARKKPETA